MSNQATSPIDADAGVFELALEARTDVRVFLGHDCTLIRTKKDAQKTSGELSSFVGNPGIGRQHPTGPARGIGRRPGFRLE